MRERKRGEIERESQRESEREKESAREKESKTERANIAVFAVKLNEFIQQRERERERLQRREMSHVCTKYLHTNKSENKIISFKIALILKQFLLAEHVFNVGKEWEGIKFYKLCN